MDTTNSLDQKAKIKAFYHLLGNTLAVSITHFTVWFAITFFTYLQTRSVFATAIISGIFLVVTATTGIWFGSLVDHHKKRTMMIIANIIGFALYAIAFTFYQLTPHELYRDPAQPALWALIIVILLSVTIGNIRSIALPTLVTILIPENHRAKANGLVGMTTGIASLVTSVISGLLVAAGGMFYVLLMALVVLLITTIHLLFNPVPEKGIVHVEGAPDTKKIDLKGTIKVVAAIPGLFALIFFSMFNNFLGGVFMALMDAYGLSLVSVEVWGLLWGLLSTGFIIGGLVIAKTGLGKNPLRLMLLANTVMWIVCIIFPMQASILLLTICTYVYMSLIPFIEAAEQTILQKVVPYERQGRVFGFAQSMEQAASPLTAFLIGPIAQFIFIPFMTDGAGAQAIGSWFGTGPARGMALVFIIAGAIGLIATIIALNSKFYRMLAAHVAKPASDAAQA